MSKRRVLVVDDESYITAVIGRKLQQWFDVVIANDGDEAYQIACRERLHLIITDYQMPVLSGYELALKLKKTLRTAEIPVLMLTARGHRLLPSELLLTNIQCLLAKPFSTKELLKRAEELATAPDAVLDNCSSQKGA